MIVGINLEWLAFGFSKRRPPIRDRGGIFNSFFLYFLFFYCVSVFFFVSFFVFCFSVLLYFGSGLSSALEPKADVRTLTVNCLLDKPACSKDLMF